MDHWIELNLEHLKHNVRTLQREMPQGCNLMAVVKANAYGHGAVAVSKCINRMGVHAFAVATIEEGIELRQSGISGEILILGFTNPARAKELHQYDLMQTLIDPAYTVALNAQEYPIKAHIKIDTGMHRLGFESVDTNAIAAAFALKHITVCGLYTHLCTADSLAAEDVAFTQMQIRRFFKTLEQLKENDIRIPKTHVQSSYAFLNYPALSCDYVRAGMALYGIYNTPDALTNLRLDLRPVLALKAKIILIRQVPCGESVGYGRRFIATRDSRVAILPIGFADGYPRNLSCGNSAALVNGQRAPIVGSICMDHIAVDVTHIGNVHIGDIATLIGKDGQEILSAEDVANRSNTITSELLSRLGGRLEIRAKG